MLLPLLALPLVPLMAIYRHLFSTHVQAFMSYVDSITR